MYERERRERGRVREGVGREGMGGRGWEEVCWRKLIEVLNIHFVLSIRFNAERE